MGKRLNLIQRGSYQRRVYLSALRYNKKIDWHRSPYKSITRTSPGKHFKMYLERQKNRDKLKLRRRLIFEDKENVKPKINKHSRERCMKNTDYGPLAEKEEEDENMIVSEVDRLLKKLNVMMF